MEEVEGFVQLRVDEARALNDTLRQLGLTGTTGNILDLFGISPIRFMIPAGGMTYQGGVWFECHSEYDCEVSVGRTLSGVQVSWTSQKKIEGGMADVVAKLPKRYGPFPEMNDFGPDSGSVVTRSPSFSVRYFLATTDDPPVPAGAVGTLGGLGLGLDGPKSFDDVELNGDMNPNADPYKPYNDDGTERMIPAGGSTMTYEKDAAAANVALGDDFGDEWQGRAMFRDWGDTDKEDDGTSTSGDGGFETIAMIFSDMMAPMEKPFNAKLADMFVNDFTLPGIILSTSDGTPIAGADNPYRFTFDRDMTDDAAVDTVQFMVDPKSKTPGGMDSHVDGNAAGAGSLQITVTSADDGAFKAVTGQYLGVSGTYTCGTADCALSRKMGTDNFTLGAGDWRFTPAANAMVMVPDQDWMAFGLWLTAPNDPKGAHRIGQFFDGMDPYDTDPATAATAFPVGLKGKAEYKGGAFGLYEIDREEQQGQLSTDEAGLFTAEATLTADFGTDAAPGSLSGEIDNFKDMSGRYLGSDNRLTPNSPDGGGEGDWIVRLDNGVLGNDGAVAGTISGSAEGHRWGTFNNPNPTEDDPMATTPTPGSWNAQFYGPSPTTDEDGDTIVPPSPSSVAGQFSAHTATGVIEVHGTFAARQMMMSDDDM